MGQVKFYGPDSLVLSDVITTGDIKGNKILDHSEEAW
jgi:hypothetical protein